MIEVGATVVKDARGIGRPIIGINTYRNRSTKNSIGKFIACAELNIAVTEKRSAIYLACLLVSYKRIRTQRSNSIGLDVVKGLLNNSSIATLITIGN